MRDITKVIDQVIELIPSGSKNESLKKKLLSIKESATYSPPELMRERWLEASIVLDSEIRDSRAGWKKKIHMLWTGQEDSE